MNRKLQIIALGTLLSATQVAEAATLRCRTLAADGSIALLFEIADSEPKVGGDDSLFGGAGRGTVRVRPALPLKIQYPTKFPVRSYYSKRYWLNVFHTPAGGESFRFSLTGNPSGNPGGAFSATVQYGLAGASYRARCKFD